MHNFNSWKIATYILLLVLLSVAVGYTSFKLFCTSEVTPQIVKYEINVSSKERAKIIFDSLALIKLESSIGFVEKKNDGRFEVLTWSTVLIVTLLAGFITINFIVSSTRVKEIVEDKINEKTEKLVSDITKMHDDIENLAVEAEKVKDSLTSTLDLLLTNKNKKK